MKKSLVKNKSGLSDVITTIIIIGIALVALGIAWFTISSIVQSSAKEANSSASKLLATCEEKGFISITPQSQDCYGKISYDVDMETCCEGIVPDYSFKNTYDGWSANNISLEKKAEYLLLTPTGTNAYFNRSVSINGGENKIVRVKMKRTYGSSWIGSLFYSTEGHGYSFDYNKTISQPSSWGEDYQILEWDMSSLGDDWVNNNITGLKFNFGSSDSDVFEIDWISIGN